MLVLGVDQQTEQTGYCALRDDRIIDYGVWTSPSKGVLLSSQCWQADRFRDWLTNYATLEFLSEFRGQDWHIGIEGTYLAEYGNRKAAVTTKQALDELAGMFLREACNAGAIPHKITSMAIMGHIGIRGMPPRNLKKGSALRFAARVIPSMLDRDWEYTDAMSKALDAAADLAIDAGKAKIDTALKHGDKLLAPFGITTDFADALLIALVTQGMAKEEELLAIALDTHN